MPKGREVAATAAPAGAGHKWGCRLQLKPCWCAPLAALLLPALHGAWHDAGAGPGALPAASFRHVLSFCCPVIAAALLRPPLAIALGALTSRDVLRVLIRRHPSTCLLKRPGQAGRPPLHSACGRGHSALPASGLWLPHRPPDQKPWRILESLQVAAAPSRRHARSVAVQLSRPAGQRPLGGSQAGQGGARGPQAANCGRGGATAAGGGLRLGAAAAAGGSDAFRAGAAPAACPRATALALRRQRPGVAQSLLAQPVLALTIPKWPGTHCLPPLASCPSTPLLPAAD